MECFLPEGRMPAVRQLKGEWLPALMQAYRSGQICEGYALRCSPAHDLEVSLGPFTGMIPREEAALGISDGTAKEIAILSRVGKPICFTVTNIEERDGAVFPIFSRCAAQEAARQYLFSLPNGTILPATVTRLEPFGALLDIGCGLVTMLGIEKISVARITHPNQRFAPGQSIYVLLEGKDTEKKRLLVSHKELLGTWAENAAQFSRGMTVPGIVRGIKSYGIFVELTPNLSGLAEPQEGLHAGDHVSVYIKAILPDKQKVKLHIIDVLSSPPVPRPLVYTQTEGRIASWQYAPVVTPSL